MELILSPGDRLNVIVGGEANANDQVAVMRETAQFILSMDAGVIEAKALEKLEWGDSTPTKVIIETIAEVFTDAADQLERTAEVCGATTDGPSEGDS